jgi:hypothetical protein
MKGNISFSKIIPVIMEVLLGIFLASTTALAGGAPVPATGQTASQLSGDDGALQTGVPWPIPRFTIVLDTRGNPKGLVKDNLTKLQWLQNANCFGAMTWEEALSAVSKMNQEITQRGSYCGYKGWQNDWRLPNLNELRSLIDIRFALPALSNTNGTGQWTERQPFINVQTGYDGYWTSTSAAWNPTTVAWTIRFAEGNVFGTWKTNPPPPPEDYSKTYVWPVRGGD